MEALLIVDVQNDFCPGGALAVPEGDAIIPAVNRLSASFAHVLLTQDWHPAGHASFASSHAGRQPYESVVLPYGTQTLWPDHCIQGTRGADFHPALDVSRAELILRKGFHPGIDSYSAFRENDRNTTTGLAGYLRERGVGHLYICGLASDFCVRWTAEDARAAGFGVTVVEDATRGIDLDGSVAAAWAAVREAGAAVRTSAAVLAGR